MTIRAVACAECGKTELRFHTAKFCTPCSVTRGDALYKYHLQRLKAIQRGIGWEFTFDGWTALWRESGKWDQRGCRRGQYVMARKGDVGPYSTDNVTICLVRENNEQAHANKRIQYGPRTTVRGWSLARGPNPYQVMLCGRYIGRYPTEAEAVAARAAAVDALKSAQSGLVSADPVSTEAVRHDAQSLLLACR